MNCKRRERHRPAQATDMGRKGLPPAGPWGRVARKGWALTEGCVG